MKTGKSPGIDGFPAEYYKHHIDILAPKLLEVYNESLMSGSLPPSFYEALIAEQKECEREGDT